MKIRNNLYRVKWILITVILAMLSSILFSYIKEWLSIDTGNTESINKGIETNIIQLAFPLFLIPIIEEWVFRKKIPILFQRNLSKMEAILFSNGLFAIVHMDWFFLPYFVNGCLYSVSYQKTKHIVVPICSHILYNLFVFIITSK